MRAKIRDELSGSNPDRWERTRVSSTNKAIDGNTIAAIAAERKAEPVVAFMDVVLEERGDAFYISFGNTEGDLTRGMRLPWVHIGSDGALVTIERFGGGKPHPRFLGSFARVLGKYVRDDHVLTTVFHVVALRSLQSSTISRCIVRLVRLWLAGMSHHFASI